MRKQKKHIRFSARAAIALLLLSLLTLTGWRDIAIYFGARSGNTEAITEECVNIQIGRTDELRQHTPYRGLYVLTLKNGTNLAVYLDDAKSYVRKPAFSNGAFALLSASCGERELYPVSIGIAPFKDRTVTCLMFDFFFWGIALPLLIVPPLRSAIQKRKSRLKKEQRKQARRERTRS